MKWNLYQQRMIIRILINNLLAKILLKTYYNYKTIISIQIQLVLKINKNLMISGSIVELKNQKQKDNNNNFKKKNNKMQMQKLLINLMIYDFFTLLNHFKISDKVKYKRYNDIPKGCSKSTMCRILIAFSSTLAGIGVIISAIFISKAIKNKEDNKTY